MSNIWDPKTYYDNGGTLEWGANLTPKIMEAMKQGEIFTLLYPAGGQKSKVLMDSFDQIRERAIE